MQKKFFFDGFPAVFVVTVCLASMVGGKILHELHKVPDRGHFGSRSHRSFF